jgi:hypothetical protein
MKSFLLCLLVAGCLTVGLEGALGNPAEPTAAAPPTAFQDCNKLEGQPQAYAACESLQQAAPANSAPASSDGY